MKKFTIYTRPDCSFCIKAKNLLKDKGDEYKEINIYEVTGALQYIKDKGFKTVPQIFLDNNHIGGYTELLNYYDENMEI